MKCVRYTQSTNVSGDRLVYQLQGMNKKGNLENLLNSSIRTLNWMYIGLCNNSGNIMIIVTLVGINILQSTLQR